MNDTKKIRQKIRRGAIEVGAVWILDMNDVSDTRGLFEAMQDACFRWYKGNLIEISSDEPDIREIARAAGWSGTGTLMIRCR